MVVPDFELICEIMLVAEGFVDARALARKFITLYSLCKELLSKQVSFAEVLFFVFFYFGDWRGQTAEREKSTQNIVVTDTGILISVVRFLLWTVFCGIYSLCVVKTKKSKN